MFNWLPNVLGVVALLLAVDGLRELLWVPAAQSSFFLMGFLIQGGVAWAAAAMQTAFFGWLAFVSFQRRAMAVPAVIVYCTYLTVSIWVWSYLYPTATFGTHLITNSLATTLLLVVCRVVLVNRAEFSR